MSSGSGRVNPTNYHFGGEGDHSKRKKPYFPSSTRRDFKSSGAEPLQNSHSRPSLSSDRRVSGDLPNRQRYRDVSRDTGPDYRDSIRDASRDSSWESRDVGRDSVGDVNRDTRDRHPRDTRDLVNNRDTSRDHRDASLFNNSSSSVQNAARNPRSNSYSKDYRYGNYKQYSSSYNSFPERSGAYGSFSGSKRSEQDYFSSNYSSRDAAERDTSSQRDSWRTENQRQGIASRFNPNNIPVTLRSNLGSLVSSTNSEHRKERYENYDDNYSSRWNSYPRRTDVHPRTEKSSSDYPRSLFSRDRLHGSSLTNSVNPHKRPSKSFSSISSSTYEGRHTDHYPNGFMGPSASNRTRDGLHLDGSDHDQNAMQQDLHDGSESKSELKAREANRAPVDDSSISYLKHEDPEDHDMHNRIRAGIKDVAVPGDSHYNAIEPRIDVKQEENVYYRNEGSDDDNKRDEDEEDVEEEDEEDEDEDEDDDAVDDSRDSIADISSAPPSTVLPMSKEQLRDSVIKRPSIVDNMPAFNAELEPIMYPEGCAYPQTKLEAAYCALEVQYRTEGSKAPKFVDEIVQDFTTYRFYTFNLGTFASNYELLSKIVKDARKASRRHQLALWKEYEALRKANEKRVAMMDEQLRVIHPGDDEATRELLAIDTRPKVGTITPQSLTVEAPPMSGRRNRRHGDLVTTEAEFQEILKTLENEEKESPMAKAQRVAATIPDLIVDPVIRNSFKFMDSNNFVFDKEKWASRVNTDFLDTFTEKEHDMFCEAYCQFPKKFGQISQALGGLRLSQECVLHYYMTKKAVNYKLLMAQYKKKAKKSIRRKKKKASSSVATSEASFVNESGPSEVDTDSKIPVEEQAELEPLQGPENGKRPAEVSESPESDEPRLKKVKEGTEAGTETDLARALEALLPENPGNQEGEDMEDDEDLKDEDLKDDEKRRNISSYWSITETNEFPHLLNQFGSQWSKIAEKLATKSATMVRNQYQRKGKKYGWTKVVAAADQRLARKPYVAGENRYSKFDTTLIVKPQRSTNAVAQNREIHVYDAAAASATAENERDETVDSVSTEISSSRTVLPRESAPGTSRISVSKLMGSPLISGPSTYIDHRDVGDFAHVDVGLSGIQETAPLLNQQDHTASVNSLHASAEVKTEAAHFVHAKPSIMNLLNGESPVREALVASTAIPPVRANIASLLNTPSSPAAPEKATHRSSNINSLLG